MELIEAIKARRAVREYTNARVDRTTVERPTVDAVLAPNARNLQPRAFAALLEGIGTCWIRFARPWLNLPSTKLEVRLLANHQVVAPIVLGYPKAWTESNGRNPAEIHWLGETQERL